MRSLIGNVLSFVAMILNTFVLFLSYKRNLMYGLDSKWDKIFLYSVAVLTFIIFLVVLSQIYKLKEKHPGKI